MYRLNVQRPPDMVTVFTEDGPREARAAGEDWQASGTLLRIAPQENALAVALTQAEAPIVRIRLRWRGQLPALRVLGDHWERGYGDLEWRGIVPERPLPWYFVAWDGSAAMGCGVMTGANAICFWQVDEDGVSLWVDTRCGAVGFLPKEPLELCRVVELPVCEGETPFAAACRLCGLLCPNPRLPAQPVYGGNNWYYAYGKSSHEEILDDAKRIVELSPGGSNRPYMVMDDGWQTAHGDGYNGGPWNAGNAHFPDMAELARAMEREGALPGIWVRPLLLRHAPERLRLPAARMLDGNRDIMLDPSAPDTLHIVAEDIRRLRAWGYRMIKHDFTTYDIWGRWGMQMGHGQLTNEGWRLGDGARTTAQIIKALYQTIRDAAGEDTLVIGCNTIGHLGAGLFELQRTGDDTSGRLWERTRKMGVNTLAFRMPQHNAFFACDADCAGITNQVPWALNRQWLDLLARSGTPLFISAAPDAMGAEQRRAVRAAMEAASQPRHAAEPLDWMGTTAPRHWRLAEGETTYDWTTGRGVDTMETY